MEVKMPNRHIRQILGSLNKKYFVLSLSFMAFLLISTTFTSYAASSAAESQALLQTPTNAWVAVNVTVTPEPLFTPLSSQTNDGPYFVFLPIIVKSPVYRYTPEGIMVLWAIVSPPGPSNNSHAVSQVTITPPNPTLDPNVTPVDTPGPGSPTFTPTPKITVTPTGTATPLARLIPDGDFEGGGDQSQSLWSRFSLQGHRVIFDNDIDDDLPELPIAPFSKSAAAWLGGDDSELSYVETSFFLPAELPFLTNKYYIHSVDPACAHELFSDFTVETQFRFANPDSLNNLQSDVGGLIITDGSLVGVFALDLCAPEQTTGWGSIVYNTFPFRGKGVTIRFQSVSDFQLTSSLFIDDVEIRGDFIPFLQDGQEGKTIFVEPYLLITPEPLPLEDLIRLKAEAIGASPPLNIQPAFNKKP
jgi:hypothetical protein